MILSYEGGRSKMDRIDAFKKIGQEITKLYEDRDAFKSGILSMFRIIFQHTHVGADEKDEEYQFLYNHIAANVELIYDYAESPIEKLFLCNLLFISLRFGP